MSTEYLAAAQIDVLIATHRRHHLSGHYQLTATFLVRPCVKSNMKDPIHQAIPSDVFCPGRTEGDPYAVLMITRINTTHTKTTKRRRGRLCSYAMVLVETSTYPINASTSPDHELLRKFLKIRAEVLHIPVKQYQSLQAITYHVFSSYPVQEIQADKISVRSDILKRMFDFYGQISASRHYLSLEQTNLQARGIGNNINFWNRLRAICPKE